MKRNNHKRNTGRRQTTVTVVQTPVDSVSYTFNELQMRDKIYGCGGSTSFSDFHQQIANIREKCAAIAHGF